MRLTTKGRYAVTAMLDLALHYCSEPVSVYDVAARQGISASYLEQLFARMRRAGLLESVRGPGGGYLFTRDIEQITVSDIITAVGEGVDVTRCHGAADCQEGSQCLTHDLWAELSDQIDSYLREITLASLVDRSSVRHKAEPERLHADLIAARHL